MTVKTRPLVWLPLDHRLLGDGPPAIPYFFLGEKYASSLRRSAGAQPCAFPLAGESDIPALLQLVDGVVLPGSPANIEPHHFDQALTDPSLPLDPRRDALTLALVRACVSEGVPILGVCRGFQEINVALGGSLLQQVHLTCGKNDHRDPPNEPFEVQYGPSHEIELQAGSLLAQLAGSLRVKVNSLHGQGVGRLADGLQAIAHADDGLVEAFQVKNAPGFTLGVQWHPEWRCHENPFYSAIFNAFSQAMQERRRDRLR